MATRNFRPFKFTRKTPGKRDIAALHVALNKLRIGVAEDEVRRGAIGGTTQRHRELHYDASKTNAPIAH